MGFTVSDDKDLNQDTEIMEEAPTSKPPVVDAVHEFFTCLFPNLKTSKSNCAFFL